MTAVGMVALWHVIATHFFKPQFFPSPLVVLATGREMLASRELFEHIGVSLQRILTGFLITTTFIILINTMVGVSHIAPNKLRAAACLGATPGKAFLHVTLPATLPFILTGMRLAMGNSFATVVSAEMIAADSGLDFLIFNSRLWMATDKIFIGIVCLGMLGLITDRFFRYLIVRFAHQYGPIE